MATVQQSIDIHVPAHAVFNQLTHFEDYPEFMDEVEAVQQIDDRHLHWTTRMANRNVEWDAEITERQADRCIAWRNTSGPTNIGMVEVEAAGPDDAHVTVTLESDASQVPGSMAGESASELSRRLKLDLARMKDFIESHGPGTEVWRSREHGAPIDAASPEGDRGEPRNAPIPTSSYAAGSEGWSSEEDSASPVASQRAATGRREFPVDRPMDALRADHHLVRRLFDNYFHAGDVDDKRDAGSHVLLLLEMHTSLEEGVFYPRVNDADASLVERCEQDHEQARQLIDRLKLMDESDPQAEQLFHELADAIFKHIELEEHQLFPKVQQAGLDLSAIGHEMQAFESRMIAARQQRSVAPGLRH
ncbi:hemerythrin domain-containing protein [Noviherbaspirillum sp.]|uniref:hemerythrin domain-containing protein n=1 Tax=Noviherbaspirillum sp. TaxID=1926288 RepID=UPI002B465504|nr:hemerythrin domain-containing protein [Noviherbaspirillum sp.]HJV80684.1 hemerythrin domain-containing protein [Noviherbaspirillum sp.]